MWPILSTTPSLKTEAAEYRASRPAVLHITVDTYEDVLKDLKDSERAALTGEIDRVFEKFIDGTSGFLLRLSSSRYLAVMEERHIAKIIEGRFAILDRMREIGNDNGVVTLSIGVGPRGRQLCRMRKDGPRRAGHGARPRRGSGGGPHPGRQL